jgi:hypothetical protein
MEKRLFDRDPVTGITEWFHFDPMTGDVHIETVQDVEPILDVNKNLKNDDEYTKHGFKEEMWHYACVPVVIQIKWLNEYGMKNWPMLPHNKDLLFRLLNSREWGYLKTTNKIHVAR